MQYNEQAIKELREIGVYEFDSIRSVLAKYEEYKDLLAYNQYKEKLNNKESEQLYLEFQRL